MGQEETVANGPESVANVTNKVEETFEAVSEKKCEENVGLKEMDVDNKKSGEEVNEDVQINGSKDEKFKGCTEEPKIKDIEEKTGDENKKGVEKADTEKWDEDGQPNGTKGDRVEKETEGLKAVEMEENKEEKKDEEMKEDGEKETKGVKGSKRRGQQKSGEKREKKKVEKKEPEPRTPAFDRPVRERKSVERLVASIEKDTTRDFEIEKGSGTALKDIPNVAFKLSRKKVDDSLKLLHTILFGGRRGKAVEVKSNISRFSGFVWHGNEDKQKSKVKEKIEKCNKEKLLEFCDLFDIPTPRATSKKEDLVAKLTDFLDAPHATTTVVLEENEQSSKGQKRKRTAKRRSSTSGGSSSKRSGKARRKLDGDSKLEDKSTPDTEDESEKEEKEDEEMKDVAQEKSEDEMPEHSDSEEKHDPSDASEDEVDKKKPRSKSSSRKKESAGKAKTKKATISGKSIPKSPPPASKPKKSTPKHSPVDDDSDTSPKPSSRKKRSERGSKVSSPRKSALKEKTGKNVAKGKDKNMEEKLIPSDEELRNATCEILKEVDFNTATFTDILKQLARKFDTDLSEKKSSIKVMIQEELTKLADEADEEDEDAQKYETQTAGKVEV